MWLELDFEFGFTFHGALLSRHDRLQKTHERLMQKHDELGDEVGSALRVSGLTVSIDGRKGKDSGI